MNPDPGTGNSHAAERLLCDPADPDAAARPKGSSANGIDGEPPAGLRDLRHTFASLLIAEGANPVFVSRQLGHSNAGFTLRVYAPTYSTRPSTPGAPVRRSTLPYLCHETGRRQTRRRKMLLYRAS